MLAIEQFLIAVDILVSCSSQSAAAPLQVFHVGGTPPEPLRMPSGSMPDTSKRDGPIPGTATLPFGASKLDCFILMDQRCAQNDLCFEIGRQ